MKYVHKIVTLGMLFTIASTSFAANTLKLLPNGAGNFTSFTPSTGLTNYLLVDETTCNGLTDYNFTTTVGNRDSYAVSLSSIRNGSQINAISITPCASRNSTGSSNPIMNVFYRLNGPNSADSGSYSLTGTTPTLLSATSFTGLSLIKNSSTTFESGAVLTSGTRGVRLSQLGTVITFTPLNAPASTTAITVSSSSINVAWADSSTFEAGYLIERTNTTASSSYVNIATTTANSTSFSDSGLDPATSYTYRVRTFNAGGTSAFYSNTATATTNP